MAHYVIDLFSTDVLIDMLASLVYTERWPWLPALKYRPDWDALRTYPRFQRLMARLDEHSARAHAGLMKSPALP